MASLEPSCEHPTPQCTLQPAAPQGHGQGQRRAASLQLPRLTYKIDFKKMP